MRTTTTAAISLLAAVGTAASAQTGTGPWISFADETATRLQLSTVPALDPEEKDIDLADLDRDGDLDAVVVRKVPFSIPGERSDVLLMNEGGVLVDRTQQFGFDANVSDARDVLCVDVDGDGWLDVVICSTFESPNRVYMNLGDNAAGEWQGLRDETASRFQPEPEPSRKYCAVTAGDVTGDGAPDLFFSNYAGGDDLLYINDGFGNFSVGNDTRLGEFANSGFGTQSVIRDMDGDGDNDIIKLTTLFNQPPFNIGLHILWNDGAGVFNSVPFQSIFPPSPYMFILADFNGDGNDDIYVVNDSGDEVYTYTGAVQDSQWQFSVADAPFSPRTAGFGGNLRAADMDNDGDIDLGVGPIDTDIANCGSSNNFALLRNDGGQLNDPFTGGNTQNINIEPHDLAYLDLNGDGCLDIFMGLCDGYKVFVQQNCTAIVACSPADINADGQITFGDAIAFIDAFNAGSLDADTDGSGAISFGDVIAFIDAFNEGCP